MSKKSRERKELRRAQEQARRLTTGKVLRLLLKSLLFAVAVSLVVGLASALGVPGLETFWVQALVVLGLYALAYPVLMSEFRLPRHLRKGR